MHLPEALGHKATVNRRSDRLGNDEGAIESEEAKQEGCTFHKRPE